MFSNFIFLANYKINSIWNENFLSSFYKSLYFEILSVYLSNGLALKYADLALKVDFGAICFFSAYWSLIIHEFLKLILGEFSDFGQLLTLILESYIQRKQLLRFIFYMLHECYKIYVYKIYYLFI